MIHRRPKTPILLTLALSLVLAACGGEGLPTSPDDLGTGDDLEAGDDLDDMDGLSPSPDPSDPDPSASAFPSPLPTASASGSIPSWGGPPNDYRRTIGKGFLQNWLYRPAGLAVAGNLVFVADGQRQSIRGSYGGVLVFDGASEDAFTSSVGMYHERRVGSATTTMLSPAVQAVAVTDAVVFASDDQGVKGFIRAIPENALNGGAPVAPACRDMAVLGGVLYMAQAGQVTAVSATTLEAKPGLNLDARGLGAHGTTLWVVSGNRVQAYQDGQKGLDFDGRGTDGSGPATIQLQDVAVDPRNGEIYALDQNQVLRFDTAGKFLARFGEGRIGQGRSVAVGSDGSVYVSDAADGEVYQFRPGR